MGSIAAWTLPREPTSTATLRRLGISRKSIATQVRRGGLVQLRQGVYLAATAWPEAPRAQRLILAKAEVAANPEAVISHQSAALAWELPSPDFNDWTDLPISITLPATGGYRSSHGATGVHHVAQLPAGNVVRDGSGYLLTSLARTAVDLAAGRPLPEALVILDGAARRLCAGFVTTPRRSDFTNPRFITQVREQFLSTAQICRRTGLAPAIGLCEPCRESAAESLSAGHFHCAGLPTPTFQAAIRTPIGVFYPDFLWPELRVIGECDGAVKYTDPNAYLKEKQREQALRDQGYVVVRWLAKEILTSPAVVVDRVGRVLGC